MLPNGPSLAAIAHLVGEPARANMLQALMDGRALTAKELAWVAGIAPQTASGHLARLLEGELLAVTLQGRHRYHRLAGPEVAAALEGLMVLAGPAPAGRRLPSRAGAQLSRARTCYDHFAGRFGVALHDAMMAGGHLAAAAGGYALTASGSRVFTALGIDMAAPPAARRAPLRPCLDWSERRPHLAGALAVALACRCFEAGWVRRLRDSRAVEPTPEGLAALRRVLPGVMICDEPEAPLTPSAPPVRAPASAGA